MENPKITGKRAAEQHLIGEMIALYCRENHRMRRGTLCPKCQELLNYANQRIEKCPFMETKSFCSNCKVHCYQPAMREYVRVVMRYSGPRMLLHHPLLAVRHVIATKKEQRKGAST